MESKILLRSFFVGSVPILLSSAASAQLFLVNLYVYVGVLSSSSSRVSKGRLFLVSSRGIILCVTPTSWT